MVLLMYLAVGPYQQILASIEAALASDDGVIKVTGGEGSGKTALGYQLSARLQQRGKQVVFFLHAPPGPQDLQTGILRQLHLRERGDFNIRLTEYLHSLAAENRVVHVLIDNAEQLSADACDALSMLCDIKDESRTLVRVVLLGSPRLDELSLPFALLPDHGFQLSPLGAGQLKEFCQAYWQRNGIAREAPSPNWIAELLALSGGLPGAVLAELGDEEHRNEINIRARLEQVVAEERLAAEQALPLAVTAKRGTHSRLRNVIVLGLVLALLGAGYRYWQRSVSPVAAQAPVAQPAAPIEAAVRPVAPTPAPTIATASAPVPPLVPVAQVREATLSPQQEAGIIAEAEVTRLLNSWVQNWQAQNLPGYFDSYGSAFEPESPATREAWRAERSRVISAARNIELGWRELQIRARGDDSMRIELWLDYSSATYADRTLKELTLGFEDGRAVILRERNLTVQR